MDPGLHVRMRFDERYNGPVSYAATLHARPIRTAGGRLAAEHDRVDAAKATRPSGVPGRRAPARPPPPRHAARTLLARARPGRSTARAATGVVSPASGVGRRCDRRAVG